MEKVRSYEIIFEGVSIITVKAVYEQAALCVAMERLSKGDFEVVDFQVLVKEETETE